MIEIELLTGEARCQISVGQPQSRGGALQRHLQRPVGRPGYGGSIYMTPNTEAGEMIWRKLQRFARLTLVSGRNRGDVVFLWFNPPVVRTHCFQTTRLSSELVSVAVAGGVAVGDQSAIKAVSNEWRWRPHTTALVALWRAPLGLPGLPGGEATGTIKTSEIVRLGGLVLGHQTVKCHVRRIPV